MQKSNFQILAEELEKDIVKLAKEVNFRKQLLEKAPNPSPGKIDYTADYNPVQPNIGAVAGLGVGAAANPSAVVLNPNVLAAAKGRILADADPRVVKYQPYTANNIGSMMGFGLDDASFNRAKEFVGQYGDNNGGVAEKDDPEETVALDWKRLNNAVSNYNSQRVKEKLIQNNLFRGDTKNPYEQGVNDQYQVFTLGKRSRKAVDDTVNHILGTPKKSKGKEVNAYVRTLSQGQKDRLGNMWSQNPDQSGKIKLGQK
jgi:hypothetical protein